MSKFVDFLTGRDLLEPNGSESRALQAGTVPETFLPMTRTALPGVSETTAMKIADVFSAIKVLADGLSSLPLHVHRQTPAGRVPAARTRRRSRSTWGTRRSR